MRKMICYAILFLFIGSYSLLAQSYWLAEFDYADAPYAKDGSPSNGLACELFCGAGEAHPNDPLGGYLLAGFYNNWDHDPLIVRVDKFGNELWRKDLKNGALKGSGYKAVHYTDDGNFLIGGNGRINFTTGQTYGGIMKINSATGAMMWSESLELGSFGTSPQVAMIKRYDVNKYLVITHGWGEAYTFDASTKTKINFTVFDSDIYDNSFEWKLYDAVPLSNGHFLFVGEYNDNLNVCYAREDLGWIGPFG